MKSRMFSRTIKNHLRGVLLEFSSDIQDTDVRECFERDACIMGGAIVSLYTNTDVNDYDIYFKTKESAIKFVRYAIHQRKKSFETPNNNQLSVSETVIKNIRNEEEDRLIISKWPSKPADEDRLIIARSGKLRDTDSRFPLKAITNNAISFGGKIQVIFRFWGDYEKLRRSFDFIHTQCMYDLKNNHLEVPAQAFESMLTKRLFYKGSLYPMASVIRTRKFIERGWGISAGQIFKMLLQVNNIDLSCRATLLEQIMGVDLLYIQSFLQQLKDLDDTRDDYGKLVMSLLDKIFDEEEADTITEDSEDTLDDAAASVILTY